VTTATPTYVWNAAANAATYHLVVLDSSLATVVDQTLSTTAAGCSLGVGTCQTTPPPGLVNGSYTFTVAASNLAGTATSTSLPFTISAVPPTPVQLSPSGTVGTGIPAFTWNSTVGATQYQVRLQNSVGVITIDTTLAASSFGCGSGGICTFTPSSGLANDTYSWWVRAWNAVGHSTWSSGFAVTVNAPPVAPTLVSPTGTISTAMPSYTWNASPGATSYRLTVMNSAAIMVINATSSAAAAGCAAGAGTCTVVPSTALAADSYTWTVTANNAAGSGVSGPTAFTVSLGAPVPATPTQIAPSGGVSTGTPGFTWDSSATATQYQVRLQNSMGAITIDTTLAASSFGCGSGGTCTFTPSSALANDTYSWWVRAWNASGHSTWSSGLAITVNAMAGPTSPAAPTLMSPNGTIANASPTYTWNASSGATSYRLIVLDSGSATVIDLTNDASAVGCGAGTGTCSLMPPNTLANGNYTWTVTASNTAGNAASAPMAFTLNLSATAPATPTQIGPSGSVTTGTPSFTWNSSATATQYQVRLQNSAGAITIDTTLAASSFGCGSGGTCTFTPSTALANDTYSWWVRAWNGTAHSTWSSGLVITVNASASGVPAAPVQIGPNGSVMTTTPTYQWKPSTGATSYRLLVQSSAGTVIDATYLPTDVGCSTGTTCSIMPSTMLASHTTYSWWVRANNASGHSTWSAGMTITTP